MGRNEEWKQRTHQLCQVGGLVEIAELLHTDPATLLGGFLYLKEQLQDSVFAESCKSIGGLTLRQREKLRKIEQVKRRSTTARLKP